MFKNKTTELCTGKSNQTFHTESLAEDAISRSGSDARPRITFTGCTFLLAGY